ncbi:MAG: gliding motility-associated C-terminal domain-containing protein [Saprospiraceae bacterium]
MQIELFKILKIRLLSFSNDVVGNLCNDHNVFMKYVYIFGFLLLNFALEAQVSPVHHFSFNNCNGADSRGGESGFVFGISECECGVDGFALNFDQPSQFGEFPRSLNDRFLNEFTFSFYMFPKSTVSGTEAVDIWTIGEECGLDSIFQVRYFPINGEMRVRFSDQPRNSIELIGFLSDVNCWSYVVITKEENNFKLYIDNELEDESFSPIVPMFQSDDELTLSLGTCAGERGVVEYKGLIDEFRIYNVALSARDISQEDYYPNQIIEDKIVIFKGESAVIETGGTCSDQFEWSPTEGLIDPNILNPLASPEKTTRYTLTINDNGCEAEDGIQIIVVDLDNLDCSQLLLPSGFTPNGDGVNDMFGISNKFIIDELISFEVFDKWGGRMYYATSNTPLWDGNFRNSPVMPGPYLYRVRYVCDGAETQRNGVINVIR